MLVFESRYRVTPLLWLVIGFSLLACGEGAISDDTETEPPLPGVGASTGSGPSNGAIPCDQTTFNCAGFCNTQQTCGQGFCLAAPTVCTGECTGACGCDGVYYCNACLAHMSFTDVSADATCPLPPPTNFAITMGPDPVRLMVLQYDPVDDICVRLTLTTTGEGMPFEAELPSSWLIESAIATDHALDCSQTLVCMPQAPTGEVVEAVGVAGSVAIDSADYPTALSMALTLTFEGVEWVEERQLSLPEQSPVLCF